MGWLEGYTFRKKCTVIATVAGAQANYRLKSIVGESSGASGEDVDCEAHCGDFPNDIRFTKEDGETKHDYWVNLSTLEGTTPNRKVNVEIEIASIPASGSVDCYMYYGRSGDSGESEGDDTFKFFDDGSGKKASLSTFDSIGRYDGSNPVIACGNNGCGGGYEDFTTFTEVDVGADRIQKTANHIDHAARRDEDTYLYKDYSASHFQNFIHKIKIKAVSGVDYAHGYPYCLTNDLDDWKGLLDGSKTALAIRFKVESDHLPHIGIQEVYAGSEYGDDYIAAYDTWYYLKIIKCGTSSSAYIYSDADYSVLLDTIQIATLQADHSLRYLFGCSTYNSGNTNLLTQDIENFDICEGSSDSDAYIREIGNVLYESGESSRKYKAFYTGYRLGCEDNDEKIHYAYSEDGKSWTKSSSNPVISNRTAEDPYVIKVGSVYYLFAEDKGAGGDNKIRRWHSSDCETWVDDGQISSVLEDFTTYTETDPNNRVTVSANEIEAVGLTRNEDAYIYKDFGVDYFDAIDLEFDIYMPNSGDTNGLFGAGFGNAIDDCYAMSGIDTFVYFYRTSATLAKIRLGRDNYSSSDEYIAATDTWYYLKVERSAGNDSITCKIYSDDARTNLLDTLTVTGLSTTKFRYLYACSSYNSGTSYATNNKIRNLAIIIDGQSPTVIYEDATWKLLYEHYPTTPNTVHYATSADGLSFTDQGEVFEPSDTSWVMVGGAMVPDNILKVGSTYYMFYHAEESSGYWRTGMATSTNLTSWTDYSKNPLTTEEATNAMIFYDSENVFLYSSEDDNRGIYRGYPTLTYWKRWDGDWLADGGVITNLLDAASDCRIYNTNHNIAASFAFECNAKITKEIDAVDGAIGLGTRQDANNFWKAQINTKANKVQIGKKDTGVWSWVTEAAMTLNVSQTYRLKITNDGATVKFYVDDVEKLSTTDAFIVGTAVYPLLSAYGAETESDNLRISKFVTPEPTWGSWGAETGRLFSNDVGSGADVLSSKFFSSVEEGIGTDNLSELLAILSGSDSGIGVEAISKLLVSVLQSDTGTGVETEELVIWSYLLLKLLQTKKLNMVLSQKDIISITLAQKTDQGKG